MDYAIHILIMVAIYAILASSLDLVVGRAGLLSIAHAGFYGIGAYTSALLTVRTDVPVVAGVLAGMGVSALCSLAISLPARRLRGDTFVIATFGFQMILFGLLNNLVNFTNGPLGIPDIPYPVILGWHLDRNWEILLLVSTLGALVYCLVALIVASPYGRILHAMREDETVAQANGKDTFRLTVSICAVSAALAGMAGALYAHFLTFIDPTSFTVMESILILSMVIIGGAGSLWGPLIGAVVLVVLPEVLRFVGLPSDIAANLRQMIYGGLLVLMMLVRPQGLVGKYAFD